MLLFTRGKTVPHSPRLLQYERPTEKSAQLSGFRPGKYSTPSTSSEVNHRYPFESVPPDTERDRNVALLERQDHLAPASAMSLQHLPDSLDRDCTGYDPTTDTFHSFHDWGGPDSFTMSVVETVADLTDDDPLSIEPLADSIDPDALETLLLSSRDADNRTGAYVDFEFNDRQVTVSSAGGICVHCEPEDDVRME